MKQLFCDCKTDEEKANFFLSGRAVETGIIAPAISNDVAMAYHRCAEFKKETDALRAELAQLHKEADKFGDGIDWIQRALQAEAKIGAMEQREPAAWMLNCPTLGGDTGWILSWTQSGAGLCNRLSGEENEKKLYALPGAQNVPSVPDVFAWPECPKRRQSHVLFDDGYEEGWAACVATIKAALAAPEAKP